MRVRVEAVTEKVHRFVHISREYNNSLKNKNRMVQIQYAPGDWVLVSKAGTPQAKVSKLKKDWCGPFHIVETVSDNIYKVKSLLDKEYTVHASRVWFYDGDDFVPTEQLRELFLGDWGMMEVDSLTDIRMKDGRYEIETHWLGFEEPT